MTFVSRVANFYPKSNRYTLTLLPGIGRDRPLSLETGIDIVNVNRFEDLLAEHGDNLTRKHFTEPEREYAGEQDEPARCYAAYWAVREAAFKIGGGSLWNDYSVEPNNGRFELVVEESLYDRNDCRVAPETNWTCSVTCTDDKTIATVFAGEDPTSG